MVKHKYLCGGCGQYHHDEDYDSKVDTLVNDLKEHYCELCKEIICKYELDLNACGGIRIKDKLICEDCAKEIARIIINNA